MCIRDSLAGGYFAVIWLLKGDLDYFAKSLSLKHFNADSMCDFCECDRTGPVDLWPTNFLPGALWKRRLVSCSQWRARNPEMHAIFAAFEFLSNANIAPDELHIIHLGTSMYMLGSVLWLLVYTKLKESPESNLRRVFAMIQGFYKEHGTSCQYSNLALSFFTDPQNPRKHYPKLKGRGGEVKHLGPALLHVWQQFRGDAEEDGWVETALRAQCRIMESIDMGASNLFMGSQQVSDLVAAIDEFHRFYNRLARRSDSRGELLFNIASKFHWLYHFGQSARFLHPNRGACWIDEDFVGQIKTVAAKCSSSTKLHAIPAKVLRKHAFGLHILHSLPP